MRPTLNPIIDVGLHIIFSVMLAFSESHSLSGSVFVTSSDSSLRPTQSRYDREVPNLEVISVVLVLAASASKRASGFLMKTHKSKPCHEEEKEEKTE